MREPHDLSLEPTARARPRLKHALYGLFRGQAMTLDVATSSWLSLSLFSIFLLLVAGAGLLLMGFWGRMWEESLSSRSDERRFLRWQRFAFRGHYPLGR